MISDIARRIVEKAKENEVLVFDVEHDLAAGPHSKDFKISGVGFATPGLSSFITDNDSARYIIDCCFPDESITNVAYNAKYDCICVSAAGWHDYPVKIADPMIGINLLDENRHPNQLGLKVVAFDLYKHPMSTYKEASSEGLHTEKFRRYAVDDAETELLVWLDVKPKLEAEGLIKLFDRILMPAVKVFADVELRGNLWDYAECRRLLSEFTNFKEEARIEIQRVIGTDININSIDQLANRLFVDLGYSTKGIPMTDGGEKKAPRFKCGEEELELLAPRYPVCKKLLDFRRANKMIGTYLLPIMEKAAEDPHDRVHPTIWLVSKTGRTRSEDPNFQNLPNIDQKKYPGLNIKNCVIAPPDFSIIRADLSQIELRVGAHVSGDVPLTEAYTKWVCRKCKSDGESTVILHRCPNCGELENEQTLKDTSFVGFYHGLDLHQQLADEVKVLHGDRQLGKTGNFAIIYNASAYRLYMENPGLSEEGWEEVRTGYFRLHVGIRQWHIKDEMLMNETGVNKDIFGRKRRIPRFEIKKHYKHCLNQFINFKVQSSACNYALLAAAKIREEFIKRGWWKLHVFMINFVHDELTFEGRTSMIEEIKAVIQEVLENCVKLKVPVRVEIKHGPTWAKAK